MISLTSFITLASAFTAAVVAVPVNKRSTSDPFKVVQVGISNIENAILKVDNDVKSLASGDQETYYYDFMYDFRQLIVQIKLAASAASEQQQGLDDDQVNNLDFSGLGIQFDEFIVDLASQVPTFQSLDVDGFVDRRSRELETVTLAYIDSIIPLLPPDHQQDGVEALLFFESDFNGLLDTLEGGSGSSS